jgi:hypothetical protein
MKGWAEAGAKQRKVREDPRGQPREETEAIRICETRERTRKAYRIRRRAGGIGHEGNRSRQVPKELAIGVLRDVLDHSLHGYMEVSKFPEEFRKDIESIREKFSQLPKINETNQDTRS